MIYAYAIFIVVRFITYARQGQFDFAIINVEAYQRRIRDGATGTMHPPEI